MGLQATWDLRGECVTATMSHGDDHGCFSEFWDEFFPGRSGPATEVVTTRVAGQWFVSLPRTVMRIAGPQYIDVILDPADEPFDESLDVPLEDPLEDPGVADPGFDDEPLVDDLS